MTPETVFGHSSSIVAEQGTSAGCQGFSLRGLTAALMTDVPGDFAAPPFAEKACVQGQPCTGSSDEWGCKFDVLEDGVVGSQNSSTP